MGHEFLFHRTAVGPVRVPLPLFSPWNSRFAVRQKGFDGISFLYFLGDPWSVDNYFILFLS